MGILNKATRVLMMQNALTNGQLLNISSFATDYNVSTRTAMRDLNELKAFYSEVRAEIGMDIEIRYVHEEHGYRLFRFEKEI